MMEIIFSEENRKKKETAAQFDVYSKNNAS